MDTQASRLRSYPLRRSRPIPVIHFWENVVRYFELLQLGFFDFAGGQLIVEGDEAEEVVFHAFLCVLGAGAGAQDEWPVAGLGEQEFLGGLPERAQLEAGRIGEPAGEFGHARLGDVQMRIDPLICFVEPDAVVTFFTPA